MTILKLTLKSSFEYLKTLLKWLVISAVVGFLGGVFGSVFHESIDIATHYRMAHPYIIYFLPVGGVLIALLYYAFKSKGKIDTNRVIESARDDERVPLIMAPLIFISTTITHLLGGSAGREGAALQLGGSIGYNVGRVLKLDKKDLHIIVMTGMSSVFSALFGTPLTAAFFAIEVISIGIIHYAALVPCVISSVVAYEIALFFGIKPVFFGGIMFSSISAMSVLQVTALAALCALVSILFCSAIKYCEHYAEKFIKNRFLRAALGGAIIVGLTLLFRTYDYNGAGMEVITNAMGGSARYEAFLLKIIFTAITISAGFKGGEIVPSFFIGSTFGCVMAPLLGLDAGFGAAIGFVALFCGVVNCPIASLMLSLEVFGGQGILLFAISCAVSFMMSGNFGLYKSQKILYSKLDEHFIDINTK